MPTRRRFVQQGAGAAMAAAAALAQAQPASSGSVEQTLPRGVVKVLMATAEAITGVQPLRGHYEAYWNYRARYAAVYKALYLRFAEEVVSAAASAGLPDFAAADARARVGILEGLRSLPDNARDFEVPIFQEMLAVFAETDAWLALGYTGWEGTARGLEEYRRPPR
jgi:hypothetical protein